VHSKQLDLTKHFLHLWGAGSVEVFFGKDLQAPEVSKYVDWWHMTSCPYAA
jgi:hypothetical protein